MTVLTLQDNDAIVRNAALEEAAMRCEKHIPGDPTGTDWNCSTAYCAAAIRALKTVVKIPMDCTVH